MTVGEQIAQNLGIPLHKINAVIQRAMNYSHPIYRVVINSRYPNMPILYSRLKKAETMKVGAFSSVTGKWKTFKWTPPHDLQSYDKEMSTKSIIMFADLAIELYKNNQFYETRIVDNKIKLSESLMLSDLMKNTGLSAWSIDFMKETNRLMGNASNHIKLINAKANKKKDWITFNFVTERTPKYDDNFNTKVVNPSNFGLKKDNLYTIELRFLNFFSMLDTRPNLNILTNDDIEETLFACDIQVWDDTPAFQFFGGNYAMTRNDAAIYPETRPPKHWQKYTKNDNYLSKHSQALVNSIKFYIPQMRQMLKKYLKIQD